MVAEYQPTTGKYYCYTTDQVNSTRVVACQLTTGYGLSLDGHQKPSIDTD